MRTHHSFMTSHALFLDITPSISDTTSTLSVSLRPVHQLYHTNSLYDIKHTLCKTSQSVCMTSHKHFMTSNPYRLWHHTQCIYDMITIYMIPTLLLSWKHNYTWQWIFIRRTDTEAEALILQPPDAKTQLIRKDPDAVKDESQEKTGMTEDEMVGWHH